MGFCAAWALSRNRRHAYWQPMMMKLLLWASLRRPGGEIGHPPSRDTSFGDQKFTGELISGPAALYAVGALVMVGVVVAVFTRGRLS
jgi:hypothetical protein